MFCSLFPDCQASILSFLPLKSVILLGGASTDCLANIQVEIKCRRKRFIQRFCYSSEAVLAKAELHVYRKVSGDCNTRTAAERIHLLPTVRDRINSLSQALATSHPSYDAVTDLRAAIDNIIHDFDSTSNTDEVDCSHESLIRAHVQNVRPYKLHALILQQAITSDPVSVDVGQISAGHNEGALSVTLDRFIGDVLSAFYLLGHSDSGIIEASPDDSTWQANIIKEIKLPLNHDLRAGVGAEPYSDISMSSFYRAWIYLHASLLRTAPFSWQHQARLGIASPTPTSGDIASVDAAQVSLLRPHVPFQGTNPTIFSQLIHELLFITQSSTIFPPLRVTFNNFGPLGPAFRGRDMMESISVHPETVMAIVIAFMDMNPQDYTTRGSSLSLFLRNWVDGVHPVMECFLQLHEQSRRTRPMTVVPPLVSLRRPLARLV